VQLGHPSREEYARHAEGKGKGQREEQGDGQVL